MSKHPSHPRFQQPAPHAGEGRLTATETGRSGLPSLLAPAQHSELPAKILAEKEANLCWVQAPPGAGKTSAVRAWLERVPDPVHWFSVIAEDADPVLCALALRRLFAGPHDPGLASFQTRIAQDFCPAWDLLLDELDARLDTPTWIVIDGLDVIGGLEEHPVWSPLLLRAFRQLRFVVTSREPVPESWTRWRVNRHILCFGFEDLRWCSSQAQAWMQFWGMEDQASDSALIERLLTQSQGWGAGFEFLLAREGGGPVQGPNPWVQAQWERMQRSVGASAPSWSLLLALSQHRKVSAPLVKAADPSGQALELCSHLGQQGFLVRSEGIAKERVFVIHPIMSTLLQEVGAVSPLDLEAQKKLALVFEQHERPQEALKLLAQAQEWGAFMELLEREALGLTRSSALEDLAPCLDALPTEHVKAPLRGVIQVLHGLSLGAQHYDRAMACFSQARQAPELDPQWYALALGSGVQLLLAKGPDYTPLPEYLDALANLIEQYDADPVFAEQRLELSLCALRCALLIEPAHPHHERWRAMVIEAPAEAFMEPRIAMLAATIVQKCALMGWVDYARSVYNRLSWCEHGQAPRLTQIAIRVAKFFIGVISGALDELLVLAEELDEFWEQEPSAPWRTETQVFAAFAALSIGDRSRLNGAALRSVVSSAPLSPFVALCEPLLESLLGASSSDYDQILRGERRCMEKADRLGVCFYQGFVRGALAMNLLEQRKVDEADEYLKQALDMAERFGMPVLNWALSLVLAYRHLVHEEPEPCAARLQTVFGEMRKIGCFALPIHFHRGYSELLVFALERGIEVPFLHDLIRRTKKYHHYVDSPAWPPKYELEVLGGFSLQIDGTDRTAKFRQAAHRFELLTALVYLGGRDVPELELIACVWPHVHADARARLRQSLRRLTQSLGRTDAIRWEDEKVSLNDKLWRFDLWELQKEVRALQKDLSRPSLKIARLQKKVLGIKAIALKTFVGPTQLPERLALRSHEAPPRGSLLYCHQQFLACEARLQERFDAESESPSTE